MGSNKKTSSSHSLIRQFSLVLLIILALYLVLVRPLAKQGINLLQSQIEEALIKLERYIPGEKEEKYLPTKEVVKVLKTSLVQKEQCYQDLRTFIDPPQTFLPGDIQEAGLYFIQQLHITSKRLKRQGNALKIKVPDSFGFSEEMPEDAQSVRILLKELDLVERITTVLMEQGVEEISLVKPLDPVEQIDQKTEKLFYRELPIQLSFLCSASTLTKFLFQMKNFSPVLIVKDIIVKRAEGLSLQVEVLLSRLVIS